MSWTNLKATISAVIKGNDNQEITGPLLRGVLNAIVNNLGANAQFAGIATPETRFAISDGPIFWMTTEAGTYNLNGEKVVVENATLAIFIWDCSTWSATLVPISGVATVDEMNTAIANALTSYYTKSEVNAALGDKVDKVAGKGLSTNDYTDAEKERLAELENYDDTQVRQLITQTNANFANYYTKAESYSATEVDTLLRTQRQGQFVVVSTLPAPSADTTFKIYLVPSTNPEAQNVKDEFVTLENNGSYSWEQIGTTTIDLSGYSTTEEMNVAITSALTSYYTKSEVDAALGNLRQEVNAVNEFVLVGRGMEIVRHTLKFVKPGRTYRLVVVNNNYATSTISSGHGVFQIYKYAGTTGSIVYNVNKGRAVANYYDFTTDNSDYYGCFIRADVGVEVKLYIYDITEDGNVANIVWFGSQELPSISQSEKTITFPSDGAFMIGGKVSIPANRSVYFSDNPGTSGSRLLIYNINTRTFSIIRYTDKLIDGDFIVGGIKVDYSSGAFLRASFPFAYKVDTVTNDPLWLLNNVVNKVDAELDNIDAELREIHDNINEIYISSKSYELENIGSTLARGQFSVIPGHHYTIKVTPWDYTGQVASGQYILVFEDGYRSDIVLAGTSYPREISPYYQFTPTQSTIGVSSRGVVGSVTKMEIIDNDIEEGILNQTIDRVDALEAEVEGSGDYNYDGEKIDLKKRSYDKEDFLTTTPNDFTVIKDAIVIQMGKSLVMQSCAVYGKYFVRAYQYGGIAIYDLETKLLVADFMLPLPSADLLTLHASNISFGVEFPSGNSTFPALYVCETTGQRRCFVFDLTLSSATLLQTITFEGTWGTGNDYRDFIVDSQNRCLWIVGYYNYNVSGNYTICKKVDLRSISSPTIVYGDSDVQQSFEIRDINVIQGVFIWNDHMYIGDQRRWIVNIDLVQGKEVGHIDFSSFMGELEGLANYNGDLLVDNSTVYKLSLY